MWRAWRRGWREALGCPLGKFRAVVERQRRYLDAFGAECWDGTAYWLNLGQINFMTLMVRTPAAFRWRLRMVEVSSAALDGRSKPETYEAAIAIHDLREVVEADIDRCRPREV